MEPILVGCFGVIRTSYQQNPSTSAVILLSHNNSTEFALQLQAAAVLLFETSSAFPRVAAPAIFKRTGDASSVCFPTLICAGSTNSPSSVSLSAARKKWAEAFIAE